DVGQKVPGTGRPDLWCQNATVQPGLRGDRLYQWRLQRRVEQQHVLSAETAGHLSSQGQAADAVAEAAAESIVQTTKVVGHHSAAAHVVLEGIAEVAARSLIVRVASQRRLVPLGEVVGIGATR